MIGVVWGAAATGMAIKLLLARPLRPAGGRLLSRDRLERRGRSCGRSSTRCRATTLWLIVAGGIVYSAGVVFFAWQRLRFQNAVWHGFVVIAAGLHLAAVMDCLVINRL